MFYQLVASSYYILQPRLRELYEKATQNALNPVRNENDLVDSLPTGQHTNGNIQFTLTDWLTGDLVREVAGCAYDEDKRLCTARFICKV